MIKAHIHEPFTGFGNLHIVIARHTDDHTARILHWDENGASSWDAYDDSLGAPEPTMALRYDEAMALLNALTTHFQGAADTRQLRLDLEKERQRVDAQTAVIADVVRTLAAKETTA
jgi:hypothetical protein